MVAQIVQNVSQKVATASSTKKVMFSNVDQKVTKNLGYFLGKIYDQQFLKIAQSCRNDESTRLIKVRDIVELISSSIIYER